MLERRRHHRVKIRLQARVMLQDGSEHAAETRDVSLSGIYFCSAGVPFRGQRVVAYVADLGRVAGKATRISKDGFAMSIDGGRYRRDRIAGAVTWAKLEATDDRQSVRVVPNTAHVNLTLADRSVVSASLLDVSTGGAALRTDSFLPVGTPVTIGDRPAIVLRVENGIYGVAFDQKIPDEELHPGIVL